METEMIVHFDGKPKGVSLTFKDTAIDTTIPFTNEELTKLNKKITKYLVSL